MGAGGSDTIIERLILPNDADRLKPSDKKELGLVSLHATRALGRK